MKVSEEEKETYIAPNWLQDFAEGLYAISAEIIKDLPKQFGNIGILFVSGSITPKSQDYILIEKEHLIYCEKFVNQTQYIGVIIGQEIKLV